MMDLKEVETHALRDELARRDAEYQAQEAARKAALLKAMSGNWQLLLQMVPHHDRTSCDDQGIQNHGRGACVRCAVIHLRKHNELPSGVELRLLAEYTETEDSKWGR